MSEKIKNLNKTLIEFLTAAPAEEDCSELENQIYADMQNLQESITEYLGEINNN